MAAGLLKVLGENRIRLAWRDFLNWERANQFRNTPYSYVNFFRRVIGGNLSLIQEGQLAKVGEWWEDQVARYVAKASVVLPALKN